MLLLLATQPLHALLMMSAAAPPALKTPWADIALEAQRLTEASAAKTVLSVCEGGTLCTRLATADAGVGFASHVTYVPDEEGCPLFSLGDTQAASNLREAASTSLDGLAPATFLAHETASVTLLGDVESYDVSGLSEFQLNLVSERSGLSTETLTSRAWHRLVPKRVHYSDARFGLEAWVAAQEYAEAAPNPLAGSVVELLGKLSAKQEDLDRLAALLAGVSPAEVQGSEVLGVDQLGFDLRVVSAGGSSDGELRRVGFKLPPQNLEEALSMFTKMFQEAWEREQGYLE